jgi:hypothetical protein
MKGKAPLKCPGLSVFVSFSALLLLSIFTTILLLPIRSAFADSYSDGYDEGCYDAGRDLKGLNGHGYDESVHHGDTQFRTGYVNGYRTCYSNSGAGGAGGGNQFQPQPQPQPQPPQLPKLQPLPPQLQPPSQQLPGFLRVGIYWLKVCNDYDRYIIEPCGRLVTPDGYALTSEGLRVLACFAGGALAFVYPQLYRYSFLCGQGSNGGAGGNQR